VSTARREARSSSGISIQTLIIASMSSLAAAILVREVWGAGALFGAAVTPVIVGIVGEALRRPADRLSTVRDGGRRLPPEREEDVPPASRQRGDDPFGLWEADRRRRSRGRTWLALGAVTGVIGFAIAAFFLTGTELVFGGSVASPKRTTIFGGGSDTTTTVQTVTQTQTAPPPTVTQTVPAPAPETVPQTVPTTPAPAPEQQVPTTQAVPPTTTAPPTAPAPAP
jgi:hypothetical protein